VAAGGRVARLYGVASLDGFGAFEEAEVSALGLIAAYLETTQAGRIPALSPPRRSGDAGFLAIDPATRLSLEIDRTQRGERQGSLLACIDRTVTSGGARALAERIARPLRNPVEINHGLDAVEWLLERRSLRRDLRDGLRASADVARAVSRLALGRGGPRDLAAIRAGLTIAETLAGLFAVAPDPLTGPPVRIAGCLDRLTPSPDLARLTLDLAEGLAGEPPYLARDGGFVNPGFRPELDAARTLRDDSRRVVADLEARVPDREAVAHVIREMRGCSPDYSPGPYCMPDGCTCSWWVDRAIAAMGETK
jgi:DNA mismatch repair protein MutS